jgi:hypothetical protein
LARTISFIVLFHALPHELPGTSSTVRTSNVAVHVPVALFVDASTGTHGRVVEVGGADGGSTVVTGAEHRFGGGLTFAGAAPAGTAIIAITSSPAPAKATP